MAHIKVPEGIPGIVSLFAFDKETAVPMSELAEILLWKRNSGLSRGERELIASYVSYLNKCEFCCHSHSAVAAVHLKDRKLVESVKQNFVSADVSGKMKVLLSIAAKVQEDARNVSAKDVEEAKKQGATDQDIHDTVLIAAAFCMFNRYVDGLACLTPKDQSVYDGIGQMLASKGYVAPLPR